MNREMLTKKHEHMQDLYSLSADKYYKYKHIILKF